MDFENQRERNAQELIKFENLKQSILEKIPTVAIKSINFGLEDHANLVAISVVPEGIRKEFKFEEDTLNTPFDPRMGCNDRYEHQCSYCNQKSGVCPGHPGHINFTFQCKEINDSTPTDEKIYVYNPTQTTNIVNLVTCICTNPTCDAKIRCVLLQSSDDEIDQQMSSTLKGISRFNRLGYLAEETIRSKKSCTFCKKSTNEYHKPTMTKMYQLKKIINKEISILPELPHQIFDSFDRISDEEAELLGFSSIRSPDDKSYVITHPRNMIIRSQYVIPPIHRPNIRSESRPPEIHSFTRSYNDMIKILNKPRITQPERVQELQAAVNVLYFNKEGRTINNTTKLYTSLNVFLQGRDGMIRNEMLGKRINYGGRTVIAPGPNLRFGEVGIPEYMAKILTVRETVTQENIDYLESLLFSKKINYHIPLNGPHANNKVECDSKYLYGLTLEYGDQVDRQIRDGDIVLFNRQPSLYKFSMMAARAKVIPEKTIRIPLPYTKAFNADFDGDEMNIHVPQTKEAIYEAENYMNVTKNIISDHTSSPTYGQVLDTVLGSYLLAKSKNIPIDIIEKCNSLLITPKNLETFYVKLQKYNIPPTDGRAIFSLLFPDDFYYERKAIVIEGILVNTEVDKKNVGITDGSFTQEIYLKYGQAAAADFLTDNYKLIDFYNYYRGFSIGFDDVPLPSSKPQGLIQEIEKALKMKPIDRKSLLKMIDAFKTSSRDSEIVDRLGQFESSPDSLTDDQLTELMNVTIDNFMTLKEYKDTKFEELRAKIAGIDNSNATSLDAKLYERKISAILNKIDGYMGNFQKGFLLSGNNLQNIVKSGAKGNETNINSIIGSLGQQNFKGERLLATMYGNRVTPTDLPNDPDPESRGYCRKAYLEGLTPKEFYSHITASREGLIDMAIGTAESGYTQRKMMKSFEDIKTDSNGMVITANKNIVQFLYGEDGMSPLSFVKVKQGDYTTTQAYDIKGLFSKLNAKV